MPPESNSVSNTNETLPLFWWLLGGFVVLALVPTIWTTIDLVAAGHFIGPTAASDAGSWWWVVLINLYIPALFRTLVLASLVGWILGSFTRYGRRWRLQLAFVALAGALGPGLLVNSGFKDNWQRARPYQVAPFGGTQQFTRATVMTDQCNNNCSFVSGHVACGFFLVSLLLLDRKRRIMWAVAGTTAGWAIGFARMADGAHWLSDVLWAGPITLVCSWLVWRLLLRFNWN
jgi:lipid A 4'-phosphatase